MKYIETMMKEPLYATMTEAQALDLVTQAEARYSQEIVRVGEEVLTGGHNIILLTGPSASGKTTTAQMLVQELIKKGKQVHRISLDNFYKCRDELPFWEDGSRNYEAVEALDLACFDRTLHTLMRTGKAQFPLHDFKSGTRKSETELVTHNKQTVLVLEGIHALNPLLSNCLSDKNIYRIYVSVHSDFVEESGERQLLSRQVRFLRRLLRDATHRHTDVTETLQMWNYVLQGEELYIQPFRKFADVHINSTHSYEPYLYASRATALLKAAGTEGVRYDLVEYLLDILPELPTIPESVIPKTSLIQEFIS